MLLSVVHLRAMADGHGRLGRPRSRVLWPAAGCNCTLLDFSYMRHKLQTFFLFRVVRDRPGEVDSELAYTPNLVGAFNISDSSRSKLARALSRDCRRILSWSNSTLKRLAVYF